MFSQYGFCSPNVVLLSKIRCSWKKIFIIQTHPSKGVQKNLLKALDFNKNKLSDRYFNNNLQKIFQTNILEKGTWKKLLIVVVMIGLRLKLQIEIIDYKNRIYTCCSIFIYLCMNFKNRNVSICRGISWTQPSI